MATTKPQKQVVIANPTYEPLQDQGSYTTFESFFPYYLGEHRNQTSRRLHLIGTSISGLIATRALIGRFVRALTPTSSLISQDWGLTTRQTGALVLFGLLQGYVWAWVGHFVYEKNKPATFKYPLYSFMGDIRMLYEVLSGKRAF